VTDQHLASAAKDALQWSTPGRYDAMTPPDEKTR
jgi:hypothetical protein